MSVSHASCTHERTPKGRAACRAAAKGKPATDAALRKAFPTPQPKPEAPEPAAAPIPDPKPEPTAVAAAEATKPARVAANVEQGFARVRTWATTARDGGLTVEQTMDGEGGTEVVISAPNGVTAPPLRIRYTVADRRTTVTRLNPIGANTPVKLNDVNALINSWVHAQA